MIPETELKPYLEALAELYPRAVMRELNQGRIVQKSMGLHYEIDDPDIDKKLGNFPEGAVPYGPIHRELRSSPSLILKLFDNSSRIKFSEAVAAGVGQCLEKAILVQLSAQRAREAFLISGCLAVEADVGVNPHAYNVVFKEGKPFLIDAENPLAKDQEGKITHPYIAPIMEIKEGYGEFVVSSEWKQGRTYSVF